MVTLYNKVSLANALTYKN